MERPESRKTRLNRTGPATSGPHGYSNTGHHQGDVYLAPQAEVARSVYLQQIRQIAPMELVSRESELADLASFCAAVGSPGDMGYMWWRAPAWSGKSALLSTFVLNPPKGIRVVCFFITSRFAGQADRDAFLDAVIEQLAALVGKPTPQLLSQASRVAWFYELLDEAVAACQQIAERLVLLVDGLDEDQGVTVDKSHSIAALLPKVPRHGLRVVVAGRLNPPVPDDVPHDHPLRDPSIVRCLAKNSAVHAAKETAMRELRGLLKDRGVGREVLALTVAAGGGLTRPDLMELIPDRDPWEIEALLISQSGRTFTLRNSRWRHEDGLEAVVLAHEQLVTAAAKSLGQQTLAVYIDRIGSWADRYRQEHWPTETPEYLFRGYFRLLHSRGDLRGMAAHATDLARTDRMLDMSGGDAQALTDITSTQNIICRQNQPDLTAALALAITRHQITERNNDIPSDLPAMWVRLGNTNRAEALALSFSKPHERTRALCSVALAVAKKGNLDRARRLAYQAETSAHTIVNSFNRAQALTELVEVVAKAGDADRAVTIAHTISYPSDQASALIAVAAMSAKAEDLDRAVTIAHTIIDPTHLVRALASVAETAARIGDTNRARILTLEAETIAHTIVEPFDQAWALISVAEVVEGNADRAQTLSRQAETLAHTITDPPLRNWALTRVVEGVAKAGDIDRAETLARTIKGRALTTVVKLVAKAGDIDRAEAIAGAISYPSEKASALISVAALAAEAGDFDRAEAIARTIATSTDRAHAWTLLAARAARIGEADRARSLAHQAETIAQTITSPSYQAQTLTLLAAVVIWDLNWARDLAYRAETLVRTKTDPFEQAQALASIASALAGDANRVHGLVRRAEILARTIDNPFQQARALTSVAEVVAKAGDEDQAETIVRTIADPADRAEALACVAKVVAEAGRFDRARGLAQQAEAIADNVTDPVKDALTLALIAKVAAVVGDIDWAFSLSHKAETFAEAAGEPSEQAWVLTSVAQAVAKAGDEDQAETIVRTIADPADRAEALALVAKVVAEAGKFDRARGLAQQAEAIAHTITDSTEQAQVLTAVVGALAEARDTDRAETIARTITNPSQQAWALVELVQTMAGFDQLPVSFTRLLAEALASNGYRELLRPVARIAPQAILANADRIP